MTDYNSQQDLATLLNQLLQKGPQEADINGPGGPGPASGKPGYGALGQDVGGGGLYNPKLYTDAYKQVVGGGGNRAAHEAHKRAISDQNVRSRLQYQQKVASLKQEMFRAGLRDRVNQAFNSPQLQDVYGQIEKSMTDNSLAGVTQQYSDLLNQQSFQTAGQGLTGSSIHAARLGDLQQGQNAAAIQAQAQARAYTNQLRGQNEQQRQAMVQNVSQANPGDAAQFDAQLTGIGNQTRQVGENYANQAASQQIDQYGQNLQSQAYGSGLSSLGGLYSGYQNGYQNQQLMNSTQGLLSYLQNQGSR